MYGLMDTRRVMVEKSTTPDLRDLARRFVDALNRRDFETLMSFFAGDAVFDALFAEEHLRGRRSGFVFLFDGDLLVRLTTSQDIAEVRAAAERLAKERG
jgi:hypothetical protein